MKLTILGTGTIIPSLKRNASGYFLNIGGDNVLVDCGSGVLRQLIKAKINYNDLDYIFITHRHTDHIADLVSILHSLHILRRVHNKKSKKITLVVYKGFKRDYQHFRKACFPEGKEQYPVKVEELVNNRKKFGKWKVKSKDVKHSHSICSAYRFEYNNKSIVFGSDGY